MPGLADRLSTPRLLHPAAWWVWGLLMATAASRTTNPLLLLLIAAVALFVLLQRKELGVNHTMWIFYVIGLVAVGIRVVLAMLLGTGISGRIVLFTLPQVPLPAFLAGVRLGGPVTAETILDAAYHGLQLAVILICLGVCNSLADPRRLLRYLPATLYDAGTAIVVALTYVPQLAQDAARVRHARQLRGHSGRGIREIARMAVPTLENSLDRSITLAASMESRGYGRITIGATARRRATTLTFIGLGGVLVGLYGLLDGSAPAVLGLPMLLGGAACAGGALLSGARRDKRTPYRRDRWRFPESIVAISALIPVTVMIVADARDWPGIVMRQVPIEVPVLPIAVTAAIVGAAIAGLISPRTPRRAQREDALSGVHD